MTIEPSLLDRDMEIIRQRRGPDAIRKGNQVVPRARIPLPFPTIMRLTASRGDAGIPIGALTRIYGSPSAGKTQLAYWIIAAAQQMRTDRFPDGMVCCYWNIEGQYDEVYVASIGIDTEALILMETDVIEDIGEAMDLLLASIHLHVIDSASFATSQDELAAKPGEWQRALHARAWKKVLNRIHHRMDKDNNTIIVIDHVTQNMQGGSEPLSGKRMAYRSDLSIEMSRGSWLFYDSYGELVTNDDLKEKSKFGLGAAGTKEADGSLVHVRVPKSRVCRPLRSGMMRLDLHKMRFDRIFELVEFAVFADLNGQPAHRTGLEAIFHVHGSWFWMPGWVDDKRRKTQGWSWEEDDAFKAHGKRSARTELAQDERLQEFILDIMLKDS